MLPIPSPITFPTNEALLVLPAVFTLPSLKPVFTGNIGAAGPTLCSGGVVDDEEGGVGAAAPPLFMGDEEVGEEN